MPLVEGCATAWTCRTAVHTHTSGPESAICITPNACRLWGGNQSTTHTDTCTTCTVNESRVIISTGTFAMKLLSRGGPSNTRTWKCPGGDFVLVPLVGEGCLSEGLYPAEAETLPRVPHSNRNALANSKGRTGRRFNDLQEGITTETRPRCSENDGMGKLWQLWISLISYCRFWMKINKEKPNKSQKNNQQPSWKLSEVQSHQLSQE